MGVNQNSTLYGGSVTGRVIYEIESGAGLQWAGDIRTIYPVDQKPLELRRVSSENTFIVPNVKNPRDSDFAGITGNVNFGGRQLNLTSFMAGTTYDVEQFKSDFPDYQPSGNNIDLQSNPLIREKVFNAVINNVHTQLSTNHSIGDTGGASPLDLYNGYETLILADVDATPVDVNAALTPANVVDRFYKLRNALPSRLRGSRELTMFVSQYAADIFDQAVRDTQTSQTVTTVDGQTYLTTNYGTRIEIKPKDGLSNDFAFITPAGSSDGGNLVQGFWSESELELLKMYRTEEADQVWKILMRFDIGVQYVTGEDIFYITGV